MRRKAIKTLKQIIGWVWKLALVLAIADIGYLSLIWPDWEAISTGTVPKSAFILDYEEQQQENEWPSIRWQPVPITSISKTVQRAIIVAEDARFYGHSGIDIEALKEVMRYNWSQKRFVFGGSTLSQQTVKNMFLTPSRNPLRKWHELILTLAMERQLSKTRIFELYLNVAEFGRGVYGIEAAAQQYFGKRASELAIEEAIQLAATLPAPVNHNPATQSSFFQRKVKKISRYF